MIPDIDLNLGGDVPAPEPRGFMARAIADFKAEKAALTPEAVAEHKAIAEAVAAADAGAWEEGLKKAVYSSKAETEDKPPPTAAHAVLDEMAALSKQAPAIKFFDPPADARMRILQEGRGSLGPADHWISTTSLPQGGLPKGRLLVKCLKGRETSLSTPVHIDFSKVGMPGHDEVGDCPICERERAQKKDLEFAKNYGSTGPIAGPRTPARSEEEPDVMALGEDLVDFKTGQLVMKGKGPQLLPASAPVVVPPLLPVSKLLNGGLTQGEIYAMLTRPHPRFGKSTILYSMALMAHKVPKRHRRGTAQTEAYRKRIVKKWAARGISDVVYDYQGPQLLAIRAKARAAIQEAYDKAIKKDARDPRWARGRKGK